jgi:hypothetical protein
VVVAAAGIITLGFTSKVASFMIHIHSLNHYDQIFRQTPFTALIYDVSPIYIYGIIYHVFRKPRRV